MIRKNFIGELLVFIMYLMIQILLFEDIVLFDRAFCFVYVGFILLLPLEIPSMNLLLIAFLSGFTIDIFYNSLGVHASSTLILAFFRPYWISWITPKGGYEEVFAPTIKELNPGWFMTYAIPLIAIHHFSLFYIEAGGFSHGWFTLSKVILSTLFSFTIIVIAQVFFYSRSRAL